MKRHLILAAFCMTSCVWPVASPAQTRTSAADVSTVRQELEQWYEENQRAFLAKNVAAIMSLRTEDFQTVSPDGVVKDRAAVDRYTRGFLAGIDRWISQGIEIDSLKVSGDLAQAVVRQHLVRMALRADGEVHHVETWVTQRETWRRTPDGWKLYRGDGVRDQRRLIDLLRS